MRFWRYILQQTLQVAAIASALIALPALAGTTTTAEQSILSNLEPMLADGNYLPTAMRVALLMTVLSVGPALLVAMTSFTRIIVVLSMLRFAFGMQQVPPNIVLISLALLLTAFSMQPVLQASFSSGMAPFVDGKISVEEGFEKTVTPFKRFMLSQTREQDLELMNRLRQQNAVKSVGDLDLTTIVPAFMLGELKTAFEIGFVIFLPFLLIDIVVASILMSMGMLMVPPMLISLPIKILMFILIDGWNLVVEALMTSFR